MYLTAEEATCISLLAALINRSVLVVFDGSE
jgi:hypothetical protein